MSHLRCATEGKKKGGAGRVHKYQVHRLLFRCSGYHTNDIIRCVLHMYIICILHVYIHLILPNV